MQSQQSQQIHTQPKVKLEKTVNMMYTDTDQRARILYTNLKGSRASAQFLAQLNPKVVNIVPIQQHKGNAGTFFKSSNDKYTRLDIERSK